MTLTGSIESYTLGNVLKHSRKYHKHSASLRVSKLSFRVSKHFYMSKTQKTTVTIVYCYTIVCVTPAKLPGDFGGNAHRSTK